MFIRVTAEARGSHRWGTLLIRRERGGHGVQVPPLFFDEPTLPLRRNRKPKVILPRRLVRTEPEKKSNRLFRSCLQGVGSGVLRSYGSAEKLPRRFFLRLTADPTPRRTVPDRGRQRDLAPFRFVRADRSAKTCGTRPARNDDRSHFATTSGQPARIALSRTMLRRGRREPDRLRSASRSRRTRPP